MTLYKVPCCSAGPLYVIVEFAPHGNLRDFLKKHRPISLSDASQVSRGVKPLTEKNLISYAYQVSRGMEYLSANKVRTPTSAYTYMRMYLATNKYAVKDLFETGYAPTRSHEFALIQS